MYVFRRNTNDSQRQSGTVLRYDVYVGYGHLTQNHAVATVQ
jgi:hypothetical protein